MSIESISELAVIDRETIHSLRLLNTIGKVDIVQQLKTIFSTQGADTLNALLEASKSKDFVQATAMAHKLKGSAGTIGAAKLAALCARAEALARDKNSQVLDLLLGEIQGSYHQAIETLKDI
jgi:HPt (histidine-containing phosphotransfer) domain-containing protein